MSGTWTIDDLADVNPRPSQTARSRLDSEVVFLPMAAVKEDGTCDGSARRTVTSVRSGFTYFERGDVLLAKITPCMENGKATQLSELASDFGFGSTEFHVLRAKPGISPRYVFHAIWNARFRKAAAAAMQGAAGQQRVSADFVRGFRVRAVRPEDTTHIAAQLDLADGIRRKRREALRLADELVRSTFLEMFGDPVGNPRGWAVQPIEKLVDPGKVRNGLSPSSTGTRAGSVLTLSAITRGRFDATARKDALFADIPPDKCVSRSDFLVCRGNGNLEMVGVGVFPDRDMPDVLFPDTMIGISFLPMSVEPEYLESLWATEAVRRQLRAVSRTTNGTFKINQAGLLGVLVPVPTWALQQRFAEFVRTIPRPALVESLSTAETLFTSLQIQAFGPTP